MNNITGCKITREDKFYIIIIFIEVLKYNEKWGVKR